MCELLQVCRSGYYAWRQRPVSQREMANRHLLEKIEAAYVANDGRYGSRRIYQEIKEEIPCSLNQVARLMQQHGIRAKQSKRYKTTSRRNHNHPYAPNHLAQDFVAQRPGEKWCGDITYVWTADGWVYLAVVIDLYSRRIVGWAMNRRMRHNWSMMPLPWHGGNVSLGLDSPFTLTEAVNIPVMPTSSCSSVVAYRPA